MHKIKGYQRGEAKTMAAKGLMSARIGLVALFLWALLAGCEEPASSLPRQLPAQVFEGTIVAVGDSLTAGLGVAESDAYPALLQEQLHKAGYNYQVINAGISGETSSGVLARVDWIMNLKPDIVILVTGANDGLRGLDPNLLAQNLTQIIQRLKNHGVVVVLAGMQMVGNMGEAYTRAFAATYPQVARQQQVIFMPFFLKGVAAQPAFNQSDGIHPNADGYRHISAAIYPFVVDAIKHVRQGASPN